MERTSTFFILSALPKSLAVLLVFKISPPLLYSVPKVVEGETRPYHDNNNPGFLRFLLSTCVIRNSISVTLVETSGRRRTDSNVQK